MGKSQIYTHFFCCFLGTLMICHFYIFLLYFSALQTSLAWTQGLPFIVRIYKSNVLKANGIAEDILLYILKHLLTKIMFL